MIAVRDGRLEDVQTIADFQVHMALDSEDVQLDPGTVSRGVSAVMTDPSKGVYRVAEMDGQAVGCLLTVPEWSDWRCGTVLWIHSVYVAPAARQKGVYRAMYESLKKAVEASSDLKGLRLYVDKRNTRAQQVYEAMGMDGSHYHLYEWMKE
jgi:GNAT superfamily N-acetyltransferase